jgi:hypothetical protein
VNVEAVGAILLNGGDDVDPMPAAMRLEEEPKDWSQWWVAPPDRVIAKCEGCDETAKIEEDDIYPYRKDGKQIGHIVIWKTRPHSSVFDIGKRHDVPLDEFGIGKKWGLQEYDSDWDFEMWLGKVLCSDCRTNCDHCNAQLYDGRARDAFCSDTYDEGNSHYESQSEKTLCTGCLESSEQCEGCSAIFFPEPVELVRGEDGHLYNSGKGGSGSELKDGMCTDCQPSEPDEEEPEEAEEEDDEDGVPDVARGPVDGRPGQ